MPAAPRPRVALFATCMVDTLYPQVAMAAVQLLEPHVDIVFPEDQTCCGQPAFNSGYRAGAREIARHFIATFGTLIDRNEIDAIVAPSGSCVAMVKHAFEILFEGDADAEMVGCVRRIRDVTYELTEYLVDVIGVRQTDAQFSGKLTYHPCCHLLRELGIDRQPRSLLASMKRASAVNLPAAEECCGFGGLFALENADISTAMGRRKVRHIEECGADVVALNDVSCMTHLNGILEHDGRPCRAVHIAQLLAGTAPKQTQQVEDNEG